MMTFSSFSLAVVIYPMLLLLLFSFSSFLFFRLNILHYYDSGRFLGSSVRGCRTTSILLIIYPVSSHPPDYPIIYSSSSALSHGATRIDSSLNDASSIQHYIADLGHRFIVTVRITLLNTRLFLLFRFPLFFFFFFFYYYYYFKQKEFLYNYIIKTSPHHLSILLPPP